MNSLSSIISSLLSLISVLVSFTSSIFSVFASLSAGSSSKTSSRNSSIALFTISLAFLLISSSFRLENSSSSIGFALGVGLSRVSPKSFWFFLGVGLSKAPSNTISASTTLSSLGAGICLNSSSIISPLTVSTSSFSRRGSPLTTSERIDFTKVALFL